MNIAPLDLRRARFGSAVRGFNRPEVVSFLNEAADSYEQALRDTDRLRQELGTVQQQLEEHRTREATLRDTLLTAQRVSAEVRESATREAELIVREARGRADELARMAGERCQDVEREITELRRKRTNAEASVEGSITALRHALEFARQQDLERHDDTIRQHHPRPSEGRAVMVRPVLRPVVATLESVPAE
jgi:cell division initiation protein